MSATHEQAYLLVKGDPALPEHPIQDVLEWQYTGNRLHPTQKPVGSLKPLIEAFCPAGGLVLDPFCGSGSTLVAARETGRSFIGIELDRRHWGTAVRRLKTVRRKSRFHRSQGGRVMATKTPYLIVFRCNDKIISSRLGRLHQRRSRAPEGAVLPPVQRRRNRSHPPRC